MSLRMHPRGGQSQEKLQRIPIAGRHQQEATVWHGPEVAFVPDPDGTDQEGLGGITRVETRLKQRAQRRVGDQWLRQINAELDLDPLGPRPRPPRSSRRTGDLAAPSKLTH